MNYVDRGAELAAKVLDFSDETVFPGWISRALSRPGSYESEVVEYLAGNGLVFHEIAEGNPASDRIVRAMYSGGYLGWGPLDDWIGNRGQGPRREWESSMNALVNRLNRASEWLADFLTYKYRERVDNRRFLIKDLGAGSGSYAFRTLDILRSQGEVPLEWVDWWCVDNDESAMDFGRERAMEDGYAKSIRFENLNFMSSESFPQADEDRADLLLMIGIICGMTPDESVRLLTKMKAHARAGGGLFVTTLAALTFEENPRVCQVLVKLGWPLKPKTKAEVLEVFQRSGWSTQWNGWERRDLVTGREVPGEYVMVHAELP